MKADYYFAIFAAAPAQALKVRMPWSFSYSRLAPKTDINIFRAKE